MYNNYCIISKTRSRIIKKKIISIFSILAFMGQFWQKVYTVHSEKKSWLDATNVCRTNGFPLQYNEWRPVNEYIKMKAEMKGW